MSGANADKIEFTFQDVAAYFSEEEWKLLHQWQKELYRNVMKEIQQALISLGPLIAKSVFSLRAEGTDLFGVDGKDLERTHTSNKSTSGKIANSDVVLAVNCDENHYLTDSPNNVVNRSNNSSPSGFASANSVSDVKTNQDLNVNFINDLDVKGRDRRTGLCAEDAGITQIVSIEIKEETDTYFLRHQDFDKIEHQTGEGIRNRKTPFARSLAHPETTATYRGSSKEANVKITKSIEKGNAGCQSSLGNNRALGRPNITQCEHASTHPEQFYQRNVIAEQSDTYYDFETNLLIPNLSTFPPNMQKNIRPYVCTECNKSFKTKQERTRHQRTHTGERPYHCTECKKSFSLRHHLIGHQRTHTGEKPYQCTKCKKRFSLNGNLNKHQRRHLVNGLIPLEAHP